jgi:hypothetical protein
MHHGTRITATSNGRLLLSLAHAFQMLPPLALLPPCTEARCELPKATCTCQCEQLHWHDFDTAPHPFLNPLPPQPPPARTPSAFITGTMTNTNCCRSVRASRLPPHRNATIPCATHDEVMSVQARARAQNMRVRWGGEGGVERMDERGGRGGEACLSF